jgi:hypothetical protein
MNKTPVIGFIRYSCRASFSKDDFFKPEYLDYRLGIFKNITLKSFQEQNNMDFNIFLLHSENLPEEYKNIFSKLENDNPFLHNIYIPDSEIEGKDYINAVEGTINYTSFINNTAINFRIDNDDAVPNDFISRLNNFLKPEYLDFVISFPNINIIQRTRKNKYLLQKKYFPSNSIGLAYVTDKNNYKTIMTLGDHGKVNQNHPMVLLPGNGGFQTINGKNIMNSLYFGHVSSLDSNSIKDYLKNNGYSNFNLTCLNIIKRRVIMETFAKTRNFIKKNKVTSS